MSINGLSRIATRKKNPSLCEYFQGVFQLQNDHLHIFNNAEHLYSDQANQLMGIQRRLGSVTSRLGGARQHNHQANNPMVQALSSCISRPDICQCLVVQTPMDNIPKAYAMHINYPRRLRISSVVWSFLNPCQEIWVAIGRADVYYARATHAFSVGSKLMSALHI